MLQAVRLVLLTILLATEFASVVLAHADSSAPLTPQTDFAQAGTAGTPQAGTTAPASSLPQETAQSTRPSDPPESALQAKEVTLPSPSNTVDEEAAQAIALSSEAEDTAAVNRFPTYMLLGVILVTLAIASIVGQYLRRQPSELVNPALVSRFSQRVNTWWLMSAVLTFSIAIHSIGTVVLFAMVSFWALREFITMAPTRRGDHRALFWALIVFTPLQYVLIGLERIDWWHAIDYYGLYSIMIPVYASIFVPARIALSGDHKRFLERSAQITSGLLICVYALSHAPALINLKLAGSDGTPWNGSPVGLFFFFVLLSQLSEIFQWTWGQIVGRRMIAEDVSTSRTWEGFFGGTLSLGIVGAALWWVTPFRIWEAACMSMVIGVMGMFGCMTMSAIKRDRGVTDYGSLVQGHAGILDRIDTLCFAAPIFFHLTRFFFTIE